MEIDWSNILIWIVIVVLAIIALSFFMKGAFTIVVLVVLIAIVYLIYRNYTKEGESHSIEKMFK
jgi:positive regulator of sigma E activity